MPYSGVYPYYAQHGMAGIFCAAAKMRLRQQDFQFLPVYTAQGGNNATLEAVRKLLFFEGVDVLTGMINIKVLTDIRPLLENHQKIGLFFDMGEMVPPPLGFGPNVMSISMNLWQGQYALGKWAAQEFGKDGLVISPVFEAGFNLNTAFFHGAAAGGADKIQSITLNDENAGQNGLVLDSLFEALQSHTPDFVHAIFTGKMGIDFLQQWSTSKFANHVPLLVVENMAYEDVLDDVKHLGLNVYSAATWSRKSESPNNKQFVQDFEDFGKQQANIFGMIGYEIGLSLSVMMPYLSKGDAKGALQYLQQQSVAGPRGTLSVQSNGLERPLIDIAKTTTNAKNINQTIITQSTAVGLNTSTIFEETASGWQNPYLSV